MPVNVLHEDHELLIVNKPAGLVCHPTKTDEYSSLISRARLYLGPQARPHLVNRLDRETSGVIVIAKSDESALELRRIWEKQKVEKQYHAIVHGHPDADEGVIDAPLGKDERSQVAIKDCVRPDGAPAQTHFWVEQRLSGAQPFSLLGVRPRTGRKHQIRIHLAHAGYSIVGDKLYGGDETLYLALVENRLTAGQWDRLLLPYHALHAGQLKFNWHGKELVFRAEPEEWFQHFLKR